MVIPQALKEEEDRIDRINMTPRIHNYRDHPDEEEGVEYEDDQHGRLHLPGVDRFFLQKAMMVVVVRIIIITILSSSWSSTSYLHKKTMVMVAIIIVTLLLLLVVEQNLRPRSHKPHS